MPLYKYLEAINTLINHGVTIDPPIDFDRDIINDLEKRWGHALPRSYKQMLSDYGTLWFQNIEIYGLTKAGFNGNSIPDVIFATEFLRERKEITGSMVRIRSSGYGPYYVIECAELNELCEAPIYEINELGYTEGMEKVSDSFGDYIFEEAKLAIDIMNDNGVA